MTSDTKLSKEQREEMDRLAELNARAMKPQDGKMSQRDFIAGFTAGVESNNKRTQCLVEALKAYDYHEGLPATLNLALYQYQKGTSDE